MGTGRTVHFEQHSINLGLPQLQSAPFGDVCSSWHHCDQSAPRKIFVRYVLVA